MNGTERLYVIIRVRNSLDRPEVADIFWEPMKVAGDARIRFETQQDVEIFVR